MVANVGNLVKSGSRSDIHIPSKCHDPVQCYRAAGKYWALPSQGIKNSNGRDGYEYVIITPPDAGFVAWGETLKDWRKLQGISTEVYTTDETGTTSSAIESWLNNAYNTWGTPPAAFLLLGDYPNSESGYVGITSPEWNGYCVSDNMYADVDGDDLPDMAHGRICARNATELGQMITKMLDYEQVPYTDPGFYDHPVIAGGWQTERWFILCTEVIFGHQTNALGKNPVREYAIYSGSPGTAWSTAPNTSTVVNYFGPNGLGYLPSTPEHLSDWGGNATRVNNDLNSGAFMLMHRDHGYEYGWGEPDYDKYDLDNLNNTKYPFVFSINCLTGRYDYSQETFTEKFHRMNQGALGLVAASEISYSFVNDTFVWGMFDGMWPDFMPDYGPFTHGPDPLRTCFGMCHGKYFLQASSWPYNTSNKDETNNLFHHHGDAFLRMYTEVPQNLTVAHAAELEEGVDYFAVTANAEALIALTVGGEIIGVATATGSSQNIPIAPQTGPGTLRIIVTAANYYRYDQSIPIQSGPPLPPVAQFSGTPTSGMEPLTVSFTDLSSGSIDTWSWTFGDGGSSSVQNPVYEYVAAGIYTVGLTVTGPGGSDTETKSGYITVSPCDPPVASFTGAPTAGEAPLTVDFTDNSTGSPMSWNWEFGDGGTSTAQSPSHTYTTAGTYTVALTATNACGADTYTRTDYITVTEPVGVWVVITYDDFEGGMGNYTDGGDDMYLYTGGTYAHQGNNAAAIQDNSGVASSFYHTNGYDVSGFADLEVEFWFRAESMDNASEDFWVQYYDGSSWRTVATYARGLDFENAVFYNKVVSIPGSQYSYPGDAKLRFMCDASGNRDDVFIDELEFRGFDSGGTPTPPSAPNGLTATTVSSAQINLAWNDLSYDEDGFRIERSLDGAAFAEIGTVGANVTVFSDEGLAASTTYWYRVRAYNAAGNSAYSNTANAATFAPGAWTVISYDDFEGGMGNYTDGGGDMYLYTGGTYAHQGSNAAGIQDNSGVASSFYHTASYDVSGFTDLEVEFWFLAHSMDNTSEDFWVQYYDGASWQTVATYARSIDFDNDVFYNRVVTISSGAYNFPGNAMLRFMCDASGNQDDVYIDEIEFRGMGGSDQVAGQPLALGNAPVLPERVLAIEHASIFRSSTEIRLTLPDAVDVEVAVFDIGGRRVAGLAQGHFSSGVHHIAWDARGLTAGTYLYRIAVGDIVETRRTILLK